MTYQTAARHPDPAALKTPCCRVLPGVAGHVAALKIVQLFDLQGFFSHVAALPPQNAPARVRTSTKCVTPSTRVDSRAHGQITRQHMATRQHVDTARVCGQLHPATYPATGGNAPVFHARLLSPHMIFLKNQRTGDGKGQRQQSTPAGIVRKQPETARHAIFKGAPSPHHYRTKKNAPNARLGRAAATQTAAANRP